MLGSITPLGERSRRMRWGVTATAYAVGCAAGGAAAGAAAGGLGSLSASRLPGSWALGLLAAAATVGVLLDLRPRGLRLPTVHRQVDERWLRRYRGWVYGAGFGVQLGLGVVTIVPASAVYLVVVCALLSGQVAAGAAIGTVFGLARASTILMARKATTPAGLVALDGRMQRLRHPAGAATVAATALVALTAGLLVAL